MLHYGEKMQVDTMIAHRELMGYADPLEALIKDIRAHVGKPVAGNGGSGEMLDIATDPANGQLQAPSCPSGVCG